MSAIEIFDNLIRQTLLYERYKGWSSGLEVRLYIHYRQYIACGLIVWLRKVRIIWVPNIYFVVLSWVVELWVVFMRGNFGMLQYTLFYKHRSFSTSASTLFSICSFSVVYFSSNFAKNSLSLPIFPKSVV